MEFLCSTVKGVQFCERSSFSNVEDMQYFVGCLVLQRDTISTVERCHKHCGRYAVLWKILSSVEGYCQYCGRKHCSDNTQSSWYPSTVLNNLKCTNGISHNTDDILCSTKQTFPKVNLAKQTTFGFLSMGESSGPTWNHSPVVLVLIKQ